MAVLQPIRVLLLQISDLVSQLSNEDYAKPLAVLNKASVGQHVRHVIEVFHCLLKGYADGVVNYEHRQRSILLETDALASRSELARIEQRIGGADKELHVAGKYSVEGKEEIHVKSSYYRELIYTLDHTVHHMALIRIGVLHSPTISLPSDFGVSASTIRHKNACA